MSSPSPRARVDPAVQRPLGRGPTALALAVIVLAGLALRFYRLGDVPGGLYQDEAYNGLDALDVLAGARPLYFPANNGREPFYIYLVAAAVGVLGRTPLAVRLPAAVVGTLLIPAAFALASALFNRRLGLLAAAACAATFWPLALSRIGLRAGSLPLFMASSLACAALGWRAEPGRRRLAWLALGGALYGLTFYTYLASRFTPVALSAFLIFWYSAKRKTFPTVRELGAFVVPAALVLLPLGLAALREPAIAFGRAGQVSILSPAVNHGRLWATLFHNLWAAVGMFFWRGDGIARHNLPGRPVFDPLLGLAFLAGLVVAARAVLWRRHLPSALLLAWTGVMLAPTILAEDAPHFLRAVGVLPAIFLIVALGLEAAWQAGAAGPYRRLAPALVVGVLAAGGAWTARDYFGAYAQSPTTAYLFQSAARGLAELARRSLDGGQGASASEVYVDRRYWDDFASVRFLLPDEPRLHWFAEGQALQPADAARTMVIVWPYEPVQPALAALPRGSLIRSEAGPLYRGDLEPEAYSLYSAYTAEALPEGLTEQAPKARFEYGFALLSFAARTAAGAARVELIWQASAPANRQYQVFAQAYAGGELLAQADGPLGTALYPNPWWRPGDLVAETRDFDLPAGLDWSGVTIRIGLYDLATRVRLQRLDAPGDSVEFSLSKGR